MLLPTSHLGKGLPAGIGECVTVRASTVYPSLCQALGKLLLNLSQVLDAD
jgi:hypothetical protein